LATFLFNRSRRNSAFPEARPTINDLTTTERDKLSIHGSKALKKFALANKAQLQ
jgi:hypothetical protein